MILKREKIILFHGTEAKSCLIYSLINVILPAMLVLKNKYAFFILVSLIIFTHVWAFNKQKKILSFHDKLVKGLMAAIYIGYHFSYMFFFIVEETSLHQNINVLNKLKYVGFLVVALLFLAGAIEVLDFFIKAFYGLCSSI